MKETVGNKGLEPVSISNCWSILKKELGSEKVAGSWCGAQEEI